MFQERADVNRSVLETLKSRMKSQGLVLEMVSIRG
jgi:uncharacterized membrane protein YqiK